MNFLHLIFNRLKNYINLFYKNINYELYQKIKNSHKNLNTLIAITISITSFTLAIIHIVKPELGIDGITISLLILSISPLILPVLKSFELPGYFKIELHDAKEATDKITSEPIVGTLSAHEDGQDTATISGTLNQHNSFAILRNIANIDPNLALVGFRIEVEKRIREIGLSNNIGKDRTPIKQLIYFLANNEIISHQIASGLAELVEFGNRAAHGAKVSPEAASWVLDVGPSILDHLDVVMHQKNSTATP